MTKIIQILIKATLFCPQPESNVNQEFFNQLTNAVTISVTNCYAKFQQSYV